MADIKEIGFIGLGAMGGGMAANLARNDFRVRGYDIAAAAVQALVKAGGHAADTPRDAADGADLVIAMLPNAPHVEEVMSGPDGILAAPARNKLLMNCSTIDPDEALRLSEVAAAKGWRYLDCPVGRTAVEARAGKSLFMLAGPSADKLSVHAALHAMGPDIIDCGDVGHGSAIKIANNYLSIVAAVSTAEALRLAETYGVTPQATSEVINQTVATNGHVKIHYPRKVLIGDVTPGFAVDHAFKDLGIAVEAMARKGVPCFMGESGLTAYRQARAEGRGPNDWSDLYNMIGEGVRKR